MVAECRAWRSWVDCWVWRGERHHLALAAFFFFIRRLKQQHFISDSCSGSLVLVMGALDRSCGRLVVPLAIGSLTRGPPVHRDASLHLNGLQEYRCLKVLTLASRLGSFPSVLVLCRSRFPIVRRQRVLTRGAHGSSVQSNSKSLTKK